MAMFTSSSLALPKSQALIDLKHSRWTIESGAPPGIQALAQGDDGYLLIGSWRGLVRFDGLSFESVAPPPDVIERSDEITALKTLPNGQTWVGYRSGDLAVYANGRLSPLAVPRNSGSVRHIEQDRDGDVWILRAYRQGEILRLHQGRWDRIDQAWGLPKKYISRVLCARDGTVWVATIDGLYYRPPGARRFVRSSQPVNIDADIGEDREGRIWLYDGRGVRRLPGLSESPAGLARATYPSPVADSPSFQMLFDRGGGIWGTAQSGGLFRFRRLADQDHRAGFAPEVYRAADGLTSDIAGPMIEDREGNLWVATTAGLDRFRGARAVLERGVPPASAFAYSLLSARDGSVYASDTDSYYRIVRGGAPRKILGKVNPLFMCEGRAGELWLGTAEGLRRYKDGKLTRDTMPDLHPSDGILDCAVDHLGALWIAAGDIGLFRRGADGRWTPYPLKDPEHQLYAAIKPDARGRILLQYRAPLVQRIDFPVVSTVWADAGAQLGRLLSTEQFGEDIYIIAQKGIVRVRGGRAVVIRRADYPQLQFITGMARSRGQTWLMSATGVLHLPTNAFDAAFDRPGSPLRFSMIGMEDGLPGRATLGGQYHAVAGADGRLWFVTREGLARVDPREIVLNRLPPAVTILALSADGRRYDSQSPIELAKGARNIEIAYTATGLTNAGRTQFRYRLEGVDKSWIDAGARRSAFYTNLSPGTYRFQVAAANEDGVWNEQGATLAFKIPPTFLQSALFKTLCALAVLTLLGLAYTLRVRAIASKLRAAASAKLTERERIARELHDTLLQAVQGLIMRLQNLAYDLPQQQPQRQTLELELDRAEDILRDGRDRLRDLRTKRSADALEDIVREIAVRQGFGSEVEISITTNGKPRPLSEPAAQDVVGVANEALFNAWKHARASRVLVSIGFGARALSLRVSDNGIGLPARGTRVASAKGGFGIDGMRERARKLGGVLTVRGASPGGTDVELTVPAGVAYLKIKRSMGPEPI
ncbi:MAG: hypothetical protein J7521_04675 [Caulobacter sp.]|nr:hypothetical protein [Caulobacter sp.]